MLDDHQPIDPTDGLELKARGEALDPADVVMVALVKGGERYILMFEPRNKDAAVDQIGRWAANKALAFNWYDAVALSKKVRATQT